MIELHNWRYMEGGFQRDTWRLSGNVVGHPNFAHWDYVYTSTPRELDEENMIVTTASERKYKLINCVGNLTEQLNHIRQDISRGSSLRL